MNSPLIFRTLDDVLNPLAEHRFRIQATAVETPELQEQYVGRLIIRNEGNVVLPIGHTFVKGVDLFDGHLVSSSTDFSIPSRGPALELVRTYGSAGSSDGGVMGAGWAMNYFSTLKISSCAWTVVGGDGSGQRFTPSGEQFIPQKGYHTELVRNGDGSFDFFTKGRIKYRYRDAALFLGDSVFAGRPTLEFIEDPNGNRLELVYDAQRNITQVKEVFQGGVEGRSLFFEYELVRGVERLSRVTGPMGLEVSYAYDDHGNLVEARRDERVERYDYAIGNPIDPHNLVTYIDPNGNSTRYRYYQEEDLFPGESGVEPTLGRYEWVKRVDEPEGATTSFVYDLTNFAGGGELLTTVTDARGNPTLYTLKCQRLAPSHRRARRGGHRHDLGRGRHLQGKRDRRERPADGVPLRQPRACTRSRRSFIRCRSRDCDNPTEGIPSRTARTNVVRLLIASHPRAVHTIVVVGIIVIGIIIVVAVVRALPTARSSVTHPVTVRVAGDAASESLDLALVEVVPRGANEVAPGTDGAGSKGRFSVLEGQEPFALFLLDQSAQAHTKTRTMRFVDGLDEEAERAFFIEMAVELDLSEHFASGSDPLHEARPRHFPVRPGELETISGPFRWARVEHDAGAIEAARLEMVPLGVVLARRTPAVGPCEASLAHFARELVVVPPEGLSRSCKEKRASPGYRAREPSRVLAAGDAEARPEELLFELPAFGRLAERVALEVVLPLGRGIRMRAARR